MPATNPVGHNSQNCHPPTWPWSLWVTIPGSVDLECPQIYTQGCLIMQLAFNDHANFKVNSFTHPHTTPISSCDQVTALNTQVTAPNLPMILVLVPVSRSPRLQQPMT